MDVVVTLAPEAGVVAAACAALGLSRATLHRRQVASRQPNACRAARPMPARALAASEREGVIALLRTTRFADQAPAEVYATLLDEGVFLCSIRTMYRILQRVARSTSAADTYVIPLTKSRNLSHKHPTKSDHGTSPN
jgi:putative transposase